MMVWPLSGFSLLEFGVFAEEIGQESGSSASLEPKPLCTSHSTDPGHLHPGGGLQLESVLEGDQAVEGDTIWAAERDRTRLMNFDGHDQLLLKGESNSELLRINPEIIDKSMNSDDHDISSYRPYNIRWAITQFVIKLVRLISNHRSKSPVCVDPKHFFAL
jgi:hypothetical protein